jgi:uncharacterized protein (DUF302 family)
LRGDEVRCKTLSRKAVLGEIFKSAFLTTCFRLQKPETMRTGGNPVLIKVDSTKTMDQIEAVFAEVCSKHKFGLLGSYNLRQKLNDTGVNFAWECRVFEVCNPQQAQKVLEENIDIAAALPCRIAVFEDDGKITVATIKPTRLLELFDVPELGPVAREVENTLVQIMRDLT